jgi:CheY-like chemotaxis protein
MSDDIPKGAAALAGKRVLVVEDEFLIALDIQNILENAGAEAVLAYRVNEALETIRSNGPFAAALLDLKLDGETSIPIAEKLHADGVPFVFSTGMPGDAAIAARFPDVTIVTKPFDAEMLVSALAAAMSTRH